MHNPSYESQAEVGGALTWLSQVSGFVLAPPVEKHDGCGVGSVGLVIAPDVLPMLADRGVPVSLDGWSAEPKLDGWRARVLVDDRGVRVRTRSGVDVTQQVVSVRSLVGRNLVLDGELVTGAGRMEDFYGIGAALARRRDVVFVAFDVLWVDGELTTALPYEQRRSVLTGLGLAIPLVPSVSFEDAPELFAACSRLGVEGIVLKQLSSPYRAGMRSPSWRKVKVGDWSEHFRRRFVR